MEENLKEVKELFQLLKNEQEAEKNGKENETEADDMRVKHLEVVITQLMEKNLNWVRDSLEKIESFDDKIRELKENLEGKMFIILEQTRQNDAIITHTKEIIEAQIEQQSEDKVQNKEYLENSQGNLQEGFREIQAIQANTLDKITEINENVQEKFAETLQLMANDDEQLVQDIREVDTRQENRNDLTKEELKMKIEDSKELIVKAVQKWNENTLNMIGEGLEAQRQHNGKMNKMEDSIVAGLKRNEEVIETSHAIIMENLEEANRDRERKEDGLFKHYIKKVA
jgi:hypothetical protein